MSFDTTAEQKKKLLKAKIAVALHDELGRVPKKEEIENVFLLARVMVQSCVGPTLPTATAEERRSTRYFLHSLYLRLINKQLACYNPDINSPATP